MNKNSLYLTFKLAALAGAVSEELSADTSGGSPVACALAFCCLFTAEILVNRFYPSKKIQILCPSAGIAGCILCGPEKYYPLFVMLIFELIEFLEAEEYFYTISASAAFLSALIFRPERYTLTTAFLLAAAWIFSRTAVDRLEYFRELSEKQRETITSQNERINKLKKWSGTLRETAAFEERSRFSMRIHDKLGHGISGSIILLEGAKLNLKTNPEQAEKSLRTAIENLRGSVDSIREALHEERPKRSTAGAAELKEMLERFSADYNIKTEFCIDGDTEKIQPRIWSCIKENLTEALTNTVKHSNASEFVLRIKIYERIVNAEFSDNGSDIKNFSKGMGLDGIEDRVAVCGGKCLFQCGINGFKIINIFGVEL